MCKCVFSCIPMSVCICVSVCVFLSVCVAIYVCIINLFEFMFAVFECLHFCFCICVLHLFVLLCEFIFICLFASVTECVEFKNFFFFVCV